MRWIFLIFFLGSPATADDLDPSVLEAPNRIWLRASAPQYVQQGISIPFLSYVSFQDGMLRDHIAYSYFVIGPESCVDFERGCAESTKSTAVLEGRFELEGVNIFLTDYNFSPLRFERQKYTSADLLSQTFSAEMANSSFTLESDTLLRQGSNGLVRYLAANESDIPEIFALNREIFELSRDSSLRIAVNYECFVSGHISRQLAPETDEMSHALVALAKYGAMKIALEDQISDILGRNTISPFDLPQQESDALELLSMEKLFTEFAVLHMRNELGGSNGSEAAPALPAIPDIASIIPAGMLQNIPPDQLPGLLEKVSNNLEAAQKAMPALLALSTEEMDSVDKLDLLCS
jgi:hypothetical protein